jgi:hypothetical protein
LNNKFTMKRCVKKLIIVLSFLILFQLNSRAQGKIDSFDKLIYISINIYTSTINRSILLIKDLNALAIIDENEFESYTKIQEINKMTSTLSDILKECEVHQLGNLLKDEK